MRLVTLSGLGVTATSKRQLKSGSQYNRYFPLGSLQNRTTTVSNSASTHRTLREMKKLVNRTTNQTSGIAQVLKGHSLSQTLQNIWHFVYEHIQYKPDTPGIEEIKTPVRIWADRQSGSDCDDYSIFISSILTNLGIPHLFRMTKYGGDWQHVYVIVPKSGSSKAVNSRADYYVLDAVADRFNYEHLFTEKYDLPMKTPLVTLSGLFGVSNLKGCDCQNNVQPVTNSGVTQTQTNKQVVNVQVQPQYVREASLLQNNMVKTTDTLSQANIPFQKIINEATGKPAIAVQVGNKVAQLNTVLPAEEAQLIVAAIKDPTLLVENPTITTSNAGIGWLGALVLGGFLLWGLQGGNPAKISAHKNTKAKKPRKKNRKAATPRVPVVDLRSK